MSIYDRDPEFCQLMTPESEWAEAIRNAVRYIWTGEASDSLTAHELDYATVRNRLMREAQWTLDEVHAAFAATEAQLEMELYGRR